MKKVLIVHGQLIEIGGAEKSILGLYEKLKKYFKVNFYYQLGKENKKANAIYKSAIRKVLFLYTFPLEFLKLRKIIKKHDLIFISITGNILCLPSYWSSLILGKIYGKKVILYVHEPPLSFWSLTDKRKVLLSFIKILDILIFNIFKPSKIIANSELTKKIVSINYKINQNKIEVIYPIFHLK